MARLIWSYDALRNLNAIAEYIGKDSPIDAQQAVRTIFEKTEKLLTFPRSNRKVPKRNLDQFREILFKNYRVVYEIKPNNIIEDLIVIHQKQILRL